jgi:hypothetical protein
VQIFLKSMMDYCGNGFFLPRLCPKPINLRANIWRRTQKTDLNRCKNRINKMNKHLLPF